MKQILDTYFRLPHVAAAALLCSTVYTAVTLVDTSLNRLNNKGGLGSLNHYQLLKEIAADTEQPPARIISADVTAAIPLFYGLDTFDGMLTNFPERRNYFLAYGASNPAKEVYHTHRHSFFRFPKNYNINFFRIANVRYVFGSKPIKHPQLKLVGHQPGITANELDYTFNGLAERFDKVSLIKPLYLYELSDYWPRVFYAGAVIQSPHSYKDKAYYTQLGDLSRGDVLFDSTVTMPALPESTLTPETLLNYILNPEGVEIQPDESGALVVFNQVYSPQWTAYCDGNEIPVYPVNGIMMAAVKTIKCPTLEFRYTLPEL